MSWVVLKHWREYPRHYSDGWLVRHIWWLRQGKELHQILVILYGCEGRHLDLIVEINDLLAGSWPTELELLDAIVSHRYPVATIDEGEAFIARFAKRIRTLEEEFKMEEVL